MIEKTYTLSQLLDGIVKWLIAMVLDISSSAPLILLFLFLLGILFVVLLAVVTLAGGFKWILKHLVS